MFHKVIFATDLSQASDQVIKCLGGLGAIGIQEIVLTYALGIRHLDDMRYELLRLAKPDLERQRGELEAMGFTVSIRTPIGLPTEEILRVAADEEAELIIVGSLGHTLGHDVLLGSTPLELLQRSSLPILIMRVQVEGSPDKPQCYCTKRDLLDHVLYATDFSDNAELAFEPVKRSIESGAKRVTLLHVQDKAHIQESLESRLEEFNRIDHERLDRRKQGLQQLGDAKIDTVVAYGHATEEILKVARSDASLVIMGSQGRGFFPEVFLGSTSHNVARHALVPVLIVPYPRD
jgi:nucleotide-binding universal stress UspA family protein